MSKSDIGNYSYSDNGYNNPHAAVAIGGNAHIYDNNGNLISDGNWTHGWDYDNRLINSTNGSSAINYSYGQDGNRLTYSDGTATTTYVNKYFNISNAGKITKNLFLGDQLIATIEANGTSTNAYYVHTDHLGGSNVMTDENGAIVQLLDYYPFGGIRLNEKQSSFDEKKKFTGHEYDEKTELNYMVARYQNPSIGRFMSVDPVFLAVGDDEKLKDKTGLELFKYLENPQNLNSYSYTINNPLKHVDNTGEWFDAVADIGFIGYDLYKLGQAVFTGGDVKGEIKSLGLDIGSATIPGVVGLGAVARAARTVDKASDLGKVATNAIKVGGDVAGLKVTKHAAEQFAERNMQVGQITTALKDGVKYLDTRTSNLLHVVGEKGKNGYTIVTDRAQKVLVSTENFVRNLTPQNSPNRFKLLK